jgi:serine/threonine-protein kinase RsbW
MFKVISDRESLEITFSASYSNVDLVCEQVMETITAMDLVPRNFNTQLMLREALNNAVKHGCNEDQQKEIIFQMKISGDELILQVDDGGPGFNWREKLESEECHLDDCSGRGLPIFKMYASDFYFNETGNRLTLKIKRR